MNAKEIIQDVRLIQYELKNANLKNSAAMQQSIKRCLAIADTVIQMDNLGQINHDEVLETFDDTNPDYIKASQEEI